MKSTTAGLASPWLRGYASRSAYAMEGAVAGRELTKMNWSRRVAGADLSGRSMNPRTLMSPMTVSGTSAMRSRYSPPNSSRTRSASPSAAGRRYASRPSTLSENPIDG